MSDGVLARNDQLRNRTLLMNGQRQVAAGAGWWLSFAYRARHSSNGHSNGPFARVHWEYGKSPGQSSPKRPYGAGCLCWCDTRFGPPGGQTVNGFRRNWVAGCSIRAQSGICAALVWSVLGLPVFAHAGVAEDSRRERDTVFLPS